MTPLHATWKQEAEEEVALCEDKDCQYAAHRILSLFSDLNQSQQALSALQGKLEEKDGEIKNWKELFESMQDKKNELESRLQATKEALGEIASEKEWIDTMEPLDSAMSIIDKKRSVSRNALQASEGNHE